MIQDASSAAFGDYRQFFAFAEVESSAGSLTVGKKLKIKEINKFVKDSSSQAKIYRFSDVYAKYQLAKFLCKDASEKQLRNAFHEAVNFLSSGIFSEYIQPHIGVDEYGEFSFTLQNSRGYLDVGVNGSRELSYHVRHDRKPENTVYGDEVWDGISPPDALVKSAIEMLRE